MKLEETFTLSFTCPDRYGLVAQVTEALLEVHALLLESSQYSDLDTNSFFMRIVFHLNNSQTSREELQQKLKALEKNLGMQWTLRAHCERPKLLLLVSKASHCLNTLLYQWKEGRLLVDIAAVVSNHKDLEEYARFYQVPFYCFPVTKSTKDEQERKILELIEKEKIELVVLARYMQILSAGFVLKTAGKVLNIHHSFLPSFKGAKPYHQAHKKGVKLLGATAHYVTEDLDEGPIIEQDVIRIDHSSTVDECVFLGQDVENSVLSRAVRYHIEGRVFLNGSKTVVLK